MGANGSERDAMSLRTLATMARNGDPFACLTCYDATTARWLERGGIHLLLVGDTAAEVVLGYERTIDMPLDVLLALTAGVKRGAPNSVVMGDMPFMSYQADEAEGIRNAGRFLTEGLADIVKLEADASFAPLIQQIVRAGIPVCGHIGSRPQRVALTSGYASSGRTEASAEAVVDDAMALAEAGCQMLLIEAVPPEVAQMVMDRTSVPLIGIGAGPDCHGQILVLQDLVGMTDWSPRFVEPVAALGGMFQEAASEWARRVASRRIGGGTYALRSDASREGGSPDRSAPKRIGLGSE